MSPEQFRVVSGGLTLIGLVAALYILSWQFRVGPKDRQMWAAVSVFVAWAALLGQLGWAYLGGEALGMTPRGLATYAGVCLSLGWFALETRRFNLMVERRRRHRETNLAYTYSQSDYTD